MGPAAKTTGAQGCAPVITDPIPPKEKKSAFKTASILGISPRKVAAESR